MPGLMFKKLGPVDVPVLTCRSPWSFSTVRDPTADPAQTSGDATPPPVGDGLARLKPATIRRRAGRRRWDI